MKGSVEIIARNIYHVCYETPEELATIYNRLKGRPSIADSCIKYEGFAIARTATILVSKLELQDERKLFRFLERRDEDKPFCVVGTHRKATPETLFHELAHCFMYLVPDYKRYVETSIKDIGDQSYATMRIFLSEHGYTGEEANSDEMQAWVIADLEDIEKRGFGTENLRRWSRDLNRKFNQSIDQIDWV